MIFDWDLWPGLVAYESDAGVIERFRRSVVSASAAIRSFGLSVEQATVAVTRFHDAWVRVLDEAVKR